MDAMEIIIYMLCIGICTELAKWLSKKIWRLDKKKCAYSTAAGAMIGCLIAKIILLFFYA